MQINISEPKSGKSYKVEIAKEKQAEFIGKRIGDKIDGGTIGAAGYELELTGGSDDSGFPMRDDIAGTRKMKSLLTKGTGFNAKEKGQRRRKIVRGDTFSADIIQINAKVVKEGPNPLDSLFKKEEKAEEKK